MPQLRLIAATPAVLLAMAVLCFATAEQASANVDCAALRDRIERLDREIQQIMDRFGDHREIGQRMTRASEELGTALRVMNEALTGSVRHSSLELAAAQRVISGHTQQVGQLAQEYSRAYAAVESRYLARLRLAQRYIHEGCGDPPDGCSSPIDAHVPAGIAPDRSNVNRAAQNALAAVLAPSGPNGVGAPVFGQVTEDGTVVEYLSRRPLPNPANPGEPIRVEFGLGSPFHPGQPVNVSFYTVRSDRGQPVTLTSFSATDGTSLVYTGNASNRPVTTVPSVWEVFPNGLFVLPTVPAGAGQAIVPLGQAIGRMPGAARSLFERLIQMMDGIGNFSSGMGPISSNDRRRGRDAGCHATFNVNGYQGVGTNCSGRYGEWTWRVFQGFDIGAPAGSASGKGISIRFVETLGRNGAWSQVKKPKAFYHPFTAHELSNMTPEAMRLQVEVGAESRPAIEADLAAWQTRIVRNGSLRGAMQWRKRRHGDVAFNQNWRTYPAAGCHRAPPAGYKEQNQF